LIIIVNVLENTNRAWRKSTWTRNCYSNITR